MHPIDMKSYILEKISEIEKENIEITKKIHEIRSYIIEDGFDLKIDDSVEKSRRIYYQGIVYKVCSIIDRYLGNKSGQGLISGTVDEPSTQIQDKLSEILDRKEKKS